MHGNLPIFVIKFLDNRIVHVNAGKEKSDHFSFDMGIPKGSALSIAAIWSENSDFGQNSN